MKNKMTKIALMIVWTVVMTACGSDDSKGTINCTEVVVENTTYCIVEEGIIVETGYQCPESQGTLHTIEDVNVCSPDNVPPSEDLLKKIIDEQKRAKNITTDNNTTPTDDCERIANQRIACGKTRQPVLECKEDLQCVAAKFRPDAAPVVIECLVGLGCTESDDKCSSTVALGIETSPAATAYTTACLATRETCTDVFSDDFCFAGLYSDAVIGEFNACLDLPCDEISECFGDKSC